jgi:uncharacterized protein (TIGR03545 family)
MVIVLSIWLFFAFAFDPLLRWSTIATGQQMTGARINVDGLRTSLFPPSLAFGHVQVANQADPMTNLIEFDSFRVRLAGEPLMKRKFVIEEATLTGLRWGTPRSESGKLDDRPEPKPEDMNSGPSMFDGFGDKATEIGKDWLAELTDRAKLQADPKQFESVRLADGIQKKWADRFHAYEERIEGMEGRVKGIEETIKNAKGSTIERLQAYDIARRQVNDLLTESDNIRRELPTLGNQASEDYRSIDAARKRDVQEIRQKIDGFKLNAETISNALIGPEIRTRLAETVEWIRWFRNILELIQDRPEPERLRGIDFDFSQHYDRLPTFLVRTLKLTGTAEFAGELIPFKGIVSGLTSDPVRYGKPIVVRLYGENTAVVQVKAVIDHTADIPVYDIDLAYSLPEKTEMQLGRHSDVVLNLSAEKTDWRAKLRLTGDQLSGQVGFRQSPVSVAVDVRRETRDDVKRVLQNALRGIDNIQATVTLSGHFKNPKWQVKSNLGQQISSGLNDVLSQELGAKREELAMKVDSLAREKMMEFNTLLNDRYQHLIAQLDLNEESAQKLIQRVAGGRGFDLKELDKTLDLDKRSQAARKKLGLDKKLDELKKKYGTKKLDLNKLFPR